MSGCVGHQGQWGSSVIQLVNIHVSPSLIHFCFDVCFVASEQHHITHLLILNHLVGLYSLIPISRNTMFT